MKIFLKTFLFLAFSFIFFSGYQLYARFDEIKRHASDYIRNEPSMVGDYLSARFAVSTNDIESALTYYRSALEKSPDNTELLQRVYQLYFTLGQFQDAEPLIEQHFSLDPTSQTAMLFHTIVDIKHQRYSSALQTVERSIATLNPKSRNDVKLLVLPMLKFWSLAGLERYDEATAFLNESPDTQIASFYETQIARLHIIRKNYPEAEAIISSHISDSSPFLTLLNTAALHHLRGDEASKNTILNLIYDNIAITHLSKQTVEQSAQQLHNITSALSDVFFEEAAFVSALNQHNSAIVYLQAAKYLRTDNQYTNLVLAGLFEKKEDYQRANTIYAQVPKSSDFYTRAILSQARNLARMEEFDAAIDFYTTLRDKDATRTEAIVSLADLHLQNKQYQQAITFYQTLIDDWDTHKSHTPVSLWSLHYALGICYERLQNWDEAEQFFLEALNISPRQPSVLNYLGYSWLVRGEKFEEAERMLKIAFSQRPTDAHIMDSYGWALYKLGRYEDALTFLEKANQLLPHDVTTNDHLGDVYWELDRKLEAQYQWKRALSIDPDHEDSEKIRAKLQSGIGTEYSYNHTQPNSTDILHND